MDAKLQRQLEELKRESLVLLSQKDRLKWIFAGLILVPPVMYENLGYGFWLLGAVCTFYVVGRYISFMHRRENRRRIEEIEARLK